MSFWPASFAWRVGVEGLRAACSRRRFSTRLFILYRFTGYAGTIAHAALPDFGRWHRHVFTFLQNSLFPELAFWTPTSLLRAFMVVYLLSEISGVMDLSALRHTYQVPFLESASCGTLLLSLMGLMADQCAARDNKIFATPIYRDGTYQLGRGGMSQWSKGTSATEGRRH